MHGISYIRDNGPRIGSGAHQQNFEYAAI